VWRRLNPRKGLTLLEILLATGLALVVLSALVQLTVSSLRGARTFADQSTSQQQCQIVQHFLRENLYRAMPASLYAPDAASLSWMHCWDAQGGTVLDSDSQLLWQGHRVLYWGAREQTVKWQNVEMPPVAAPDASLLRLESFSARVQDHTLARGISQWSSTIKGSAVFYRVEVTQGKARTLIDGVATVLLPEDS
jgi:type II secretory pathway component PulJ